MPHVKFNIADNIPPSGIVPLAALYSDMIHPSNGIDLVTYHDNYVDNVYVYDVEGDIVYVGEFVVGMYIIGGYLPTSFTTAYFYMDPEDICSYQLAVSDRVKYTDDDTRNVLILPYQYQLKWDHYDTSTTPSGSISVCYEDGSEVPSSEYMIDYSTPMWEDYRDNGAGMKYRYDRTIPWEYAITSPGVYRIRIILPESLCHTGNTYYVRYNRVKPDNFSKASIETGDITNNYMEIINPLPLYYYGLDYDTLGSAGIFRRLDTGLLPGSGVYVKRNDLNNIRVSVPTTSPREAWNMRVWAGSFISSINSQLYYIPEIQYGMAHAIDRSTSALITPLCGTISYENASVISSNTVKVSEYPLYFKTSEYPDYVPYNIYDNYHYAPLGWEFVSEYSYGINIYINDTIISNTIIEDWDCWNGNIKLSSSVNYTDSVNVTYLYRNMYYTMRYPDTNPNVNHYNPPVGTTDYGICMPKDDSIVISLLPSGATGAPGTSLVWYYKSDNPDDIYDDTYYGYLSTEPTLVTLPDTTLKMAEVSVVNYKPHDLVTVYDARKYGGGIYEDKYFSIARRNTTREHIQEESNYYSDIGLYDGQGLKKSGVLVITVPSSKITELQDNIILETNGITTEQAYQDAISKIRDIIESNLAAGTYYVLVDENNIPISSLPGKVK